jgi:hypothetical protein
VWGQDPKKRSPLATHENGERPARRFLGHARLLGQQTKGDTTMSGTKIVLTLLGLCLAFGASSTQAYVNHCNRNDGFQHVDLQGIVDARACKELKGNWVRFRPHCHKRGDEKTDLKGAPDRATCLSVGGEWYQSDAS